MPIKKKNPPHKEALDIIYPEPIQATEKSPKIDDVLQASRTGHTKKLRKLILDKKMCSVEQLCSMTDEDVEEMRCRIISGRKDNEMSETPRTDAMILENGRGMQVVPASFARQLEYEILQLKEAVAIFKSTAEYYMQKG